MPSLAKLLREHETASRYARPTDAVFGTATGSPMHYRNLTRRGFRTAVARAGLERDGKPRLRFHDLRHAFASLLIAQGLNVVFVSRQLGHASPSFTLDVYGGLFDRAEHASRAREALDVVFGPMVASPVTGDPAI